MFERITAAVIVDFSAQRAAFNVGKCISQLKKDINMYAAGKVFKHIEDLPCSSFSAYEIGSSV